MQREGHHAEISGQLDTLIHQNERNNPEPVLEASLQEQAKTNDKLDEVVKNTAPKDVQKIEIVPPTDDESALQRTFWQMLRGQKGEKGDKGDKGEKGDTGADSTVQGPQGEMGPIGPQGERGEQGIEGLPGRDGRDGRDGKNGKDGAIGPRGPKGEPGSADTAEQIVKKISSLKGADRLSFDVLKDAPMFGRPASRDYAFTELTDVPHSYAGMAGKTVKVNAAGTGLEFVAGGGGGSGVTYIEAQNAGLLPAGSTVFIGKGQAYDDEFPLFVAREACDLTELIVMSITGNGGGHTDLYKVFKNGVATTMTLSVVASTNGEVKSTVANPVSLAVGDRVAVQVIADASTVAANTLIQITVTPQ